MSAQSLQAPHRLHDLVIIQPLVTRLVQVDAAKCPAQVLDKQPLSERLALGG
jgi:hypothetical protein